jgi:hypothetical protein
LISRRFFLGQPHHVAAGAFEPVGFPLHGMGQEADAFVPAQGFERRQRVVVRRMGPVADVQVEVAQQFLVVGFALDAAAPAQRLVAQQFVIDDLQPPVGEVAMACDRAHR